MCQPARPGGAAITELPPTRSPPPPVENERSAQIIDAAFALLGEAGLEALTIRAVLQRTGLARRAFYERFAGKDDLVLAVFAQTLHVLARHLAEQAQALDDPLMALRGFVFDLVMGGLRRDVDQGNRRSAALSREHLRLAESRPGDLQAALSPVLDLLARLVEEGVRRGQLRPCDARLQATLIYNLVSTTTHAEVIAQESDGPPDRTRRQHLAEATWAFCRRAIVA